MGASGGVGVRMAAGGLLLHAGSKEPQVFNDYFKNKLIGGSFCALVPHVAGGRDRARSRAPELSGSVQDRY